MKEIPYCPFMLSISSYILCIFIYYASLNPCNESLNLSFLKNIRDGIFEHNLRDYGFDIYINK